jgi:hypothetical protein
MFYKVVKHYRQAGPLPVLRIDSNHLVGVERDPAGVQYHVELDGNIALLAQTSPLDANRVEST